MDKHASADPGRAHLLALHRRVCAHKENLHRRQNCHWQSFLQSMMRTFAGLNTEMVGRVNIRVLDVARDNRTESFITNAVDAAARDGEKPPYLFVLSEFGSARVRHYVDRRRRGAHSGGCVRLEMPSERRTSNCTERDSSL